MRLKTSSRPLRAVTIGAAGVIVAGLLASPAAAFGQSITSQPYVRVTHAANLPAGARTIGAADQSKHISGSVALLSRNPLALEKSATAVSNPRSPRFHQYLPKGEFAAQYGATDATIANVRAALSAARLSVTSVSANHMFVHFSGTVGQAESAFHTTVATFRLTNGRTGEATTSAVSLPASIAPDVLSVLGLNTLVRASDHLELGSKTGTPAPKTPRFKHFDSAALACPKASKAAQDFGGLTDDQIAHAYGVDGLYKAGDIGAGQTIAVYELEPFSTDDLNAFNSCYFGKAQAAVMANRRTITNVDGGPGTGAGSGESILDVDDVSGLAPGANLDVYQAPNTTAGAMDEMNQIVQDDTANVVTTSWGFCELDEINLEPGYINVENQLFQQAALQGQSVFASSGDTGSDDCAYDSPTPVAPKLSNDDPSSQPFVVAVGGTTTTDASNPPGEQVWNDGNLNGAGGGGTSAVWSAPSWQTPFLDTAAASGAAATGDVTTCPGSSDATTCRESPDVSLQADQYTGAITVYMASLGGWNTFGGTSSSAPLWAAIVADINASAGCTATGPLGFVAPSLYSVAATPADYAASFNDVTKGNNDVFDQYAGQFYAAHTGYDMASGLGTPIVTSADGGPGLATYLCAMAGGGAPNSPAVTAISPATVASTPAGPVTVTGSGFSGATALSVGGYPVPAADWTVTNDTTITITTAPSAAQAGNGGGGPQDGSGRAVVTVTGSSGATSPISPAASLLYVDGTAAAPVPSVNGVSAYGGSQAGGNTVTVFGSGFSATGPDQVNSVTVGGIAVPLSSVSVKSSTILTLSIPAYSNATTCAAGDDPAKDVCQAQVVVGNDNGTSAEATIHPAYQGVPFFGISGSIPLPACVTGGTCEVVPAASEYDYFPTPTISSITTTQANAPTVWASEQGATVATIKGTGFDSLGLLWFNVGNPSNSDNNDFDLLTITPTEITVALPGHGPTPEPVAKDVTVQTYGGLSNPSPISFAGLPTVTGVTPPYAPDAGGGQIAIAGKGFQGVFANDGGEIAYVSLDGDSATEQLSGYSAASDTKITATTPGSNPGAYLVTVCTITFCSEPTSQKTFDGSLLDFYQPGNPVVTGVSAKKGPASGGTKLVITGRNLSDVVEVDFGKAVARARNARQLLTSGSNTQIDATAPPGKPGSTVHIVVKTVESIAEGHPSAKTSAATFTYQASVPAAPAKVSATVHGTSVTAKWKAPRSNGGHAITSYVVKATALPNSPKPNAKKPAPVTMRTKNGHATSATLKGLAAGWTYYVRVQAVNSLGKGPTTRSKRAYFIHDPA